MRKISFTNNNFNVPISSIFIQKFMPRANASFVKVYLYGLLHSLIPDSNVSNKDIASALEMLESDIYNAWVYWEEKGIIKIKNCGDSIDIEFIELKAVESVEKKAVLQTKPNYHPKEIDTYINNNKEISHLYHIAEEKLGKPLSSNDISTLFSFYDWLRLPIEVIIMLLEYCNSTNKSSMRHVEKVAIDWADKGIDDISKAETLLKELESKNNLQYIIKKAFGIQDRDLIGIEKKFFDKWVNEYRLNIDLICLACEQTIINISKPSFAYADKILKNWSDNNIRTLDDVKKCSDDKKEKNKTSYSKTTKTTKNNFLDFDQRNTDFDQIAKMISQKNQKESRSS